MSLNALTTVGFEEKEASIYHTLLKLGPSPASTLAKELGYDRTTTYYILLRMLEKGFVSQAIKGQAKTFAATEPARILQILKERQSAFAEAMPALQKLSERKEKPLSVEVRQGKEGFRFLYHDAIAAGGTVLGLGIDDEQYFELDEPAFTRYYRDAKATGLRERLITYEGARTFGSDITEYRTIDTTHFQPTPVLVYGTKVVMISWIPTPYLIFIDSKEFAQAFAKHFELLWTIAKPLGKS